eukprot:5580959-Pyramimonas_sp.AAC.1
MLDPACPVRLALHGHLDGGGYWEKALRRARRSQGLRAYPVMAQLVLPPRTAAFPDSVRC